MHPNQELLQRQYRSRAMGDNDKALEDMTDDVIWHVPGHNLVAGTYRGRSAVRQYLNTRRSLGAGTFQVTVHDVLANDEYGLVIASGHVLRNGTMFEWRAHGIYRFEDGKIAECWLVPEDQSSFDEIWS
jgi:ketosteroid isomerase-like protein